MPRQRRYIKSHHVYETSFRTIEGLPFVSTSYMNMLIESVLARACQIHPVLICNLTWMPNHPHMIVIAKDNEQYKRFYGYVQKRLTDICKRLLGVDRLNMWPGYPQVTEIADLDKAVERMTYLFCNPTKAHLVDTIEQYPQINCWDMFINSDKAFATVVSKEVPLIELPMIDKLPCDSMNENQDRAYTNKLRAKAKEKLTLTYYPYLWIKCFVDDAHEIQGIVDQVVKNVRENEGVYRQERISKGFRPIGAKLLAEQNIRKAYKPTKRSARQAFVMASDSGLRKRKIEEYKDFCRLCDLAYESWKNGDYNAKWPLGAFRPPMPPTENYYVPL